jgi:hypothetical protein
MIPQSLESDHAMLALEDDELESSQRRKLDHGWVGECDERTESVRTLFEELAHAVFQAGDLRR